MSNNLYLSRMYALLLFLIFHLFKLQIVGGCSCYNNLYNHLGTKTPYRVVENKDTTPINYNGCEPVKIWMIVRHGTRLPSKNFITNMNFRLPQLQDLIIKNSEASVAGQLDEIYLNNIRTWNISIHENDEKILAHEGENEMINLAERMQLRFPNILSNIYSNTSSKFKYTATQRTQQSAHYFATGLFGRKTAASVWYPKPLHRDPILRFYKLCAKWRKEIKKNSETVKERDLFVNSSIVRKVLRDVSAKLGFTKDLNFADLRIMYMTCAYESSWTKKTISPWCAVFSNETIKVMEYAEDLRYYWIDGPGFTLNYKQACPAVKNLVEYFTQENTYPKAILYFTHSGTILKLLSHFGLYHDKQPLKHNNFKEHYQRLWRVSKIDAFASNIAAVLFRCDKKKKILFLHQERIVKIPGCSEELCDLKTFLNVFNESINNCNFDEMCKL